MGSGWGTRWDLVGGPGGTLDTSPSTEPTWLGDQVGHSWGTRWDLGPGGISLVRGTRLDMVKGTRRNMVGGSR